MSGNKNSGGARRGSGPVRRRLTLSFPAALLIREKTRANHKRRDVTEEELNATLETIVLEWAKNLVIPEPAEY
jgi:mRNA degradation ribonuclease J1/J2